MRRRPANGLSEERESLWGLVVPPSLWAAHFLLSYVTISIWCAKAAGPEGALGPVRAAIGAYTVVALAGIAASAWSGWKRHRFGRGELPHDADTPGDRHRFLGFATFLIAALSGVATLYSALVVPFFGSCR